MLSNSALVVVESGLERYTFIGLLREVMMKVCLACGPSRSESNQKTFLKRVQVHYLFSLFKLIFLCMTGYLYKIRLST